MIVLIAAVSVGIAYFIANSLLGGITEQGVKVKTVDPITSTVEQPDPAIFNEQAINPSVEVNINSTATNSSSTSQSNSTTTNTTSGANTSSNAPR